MIVSHHGKLELVAPKSPTLEALTLSYLDDLDAKLHQFQQLMAADLNADSHWTIYHAHLGENCLRGQPMPKPHDDASHARELELTDQIVALVRAPDYKPQKPRLIGERLRVEVKRSTLSRKSSSD